MSVIVVLNVYHDHYCNYPCCYVDLLLNQDCYVYPLTVVAVFLLQEASLWFGRFQEHRSPGRGAATRRPGCCLLVDMFIGNSWKVVVY